MGEVVRLGTPAKNGSSVRTRRAPKRSAGAGARGRSKRKAHKTALVLGGGGFTGGVYEIGALRALDLLASKRTVNDFDIYVGTSAGAFVAALSANGITPEEMMRVVTHQGYGSFRDVDLGDLLKLNVREFARTGIRLPLRAASLARRLLPQLGQISLIDVVLGLAETLPSGAYTGEGIERYLSKVLSEAERSNDFRTLDHELYLVATDLDTCERVVFGSPGYDDVPISTAVRASGALPMVYSPVKVGKRELIDGGIASTTNLDIAVQAGAQLVIVINPIVPYVNDLLDGDGAGADGGGGDGDRAQRRARRISDMGFSKVGYQAFKLLAHRRLHELAGMWEERYPGVDIVLIEPEPTDELMFETSILDFASRVEIARHGFESVTRHLLDEYERYSEIWARHGLEISQRRMRAIFERSGSGRHPVEGAKQAR
jgi:NTE family protein